MSQETVLNVNGRTHHLDVDPDTPLIYTLRNDLGLMAAIRRPSVPATYSLFQQPGRCRVQRYTSG